MSALSTRAAMAKALQDIADARCRYHGPDYGGCVDSQCSPMVEEMVDALLDSGAVVDAATLADDEALVERVALGTLGPSAQMDEYTRDGQDLILRRARRALHALAASLTERGESRAAQ